MKLKAFIVASFFVHVAGAFALWFYYNKPSGLAPRPVKFLDQGKNDHPLPDSFTNEEEAPGRSIPLKGGPNQEQKTSLKPKPLKKQALKKKKASKPGASKEKAPSNANASPVAVAQSDTKTDKGLKPLPEDLKGGELENNDLKEKAPSNTDASPVDVAQSDAKADKGLKPLPEDLKGELENNDLKEKAPSNADASPVAVAQSDATADKGLEPLPEDLKGELENNDLKEKTPSNADASPVVEAQPDDTSDSPVPVYDFMADQEPADLSPADQKSKTGLESDDKSPKGEEEVSDPAPVSTKEEISPELKSSADRAENNTSSKKKPLPPTQQIKDFSVLKQKIGNRPLHYPDFARREGMQGTVSVLFYVTPQGLVDQIHLESSSGHSQLDNFVLQRVSDYEFLPGQESWIRYKIPFTLKGIEVEMLRLREADE